MLGTWGQCGQCSMILSIRSWYGLRAAGAQFSALGHLRACDSNLS